MTEINIPDYFELFRLHSRNLAPYSAAFLDQKKTWSEKPWFQNVYRQSDLAEVQVCMCTALLELYGLKPIFPFSFMSYSPATVVHFPLVPTMRVSLFKNTCGIVTTPLIHLYKPPNFHSFISYQPFSQSSELSNSTTSIADKSFTSCRPWKCVNYPRTQFPLMRDQTLYTEETFLSIRWSTSQDGQL